ncbi:glycosyltransferase [Amaricoccus solimangrovi]|uniref:Glycosyltransferase family 4 protein n=1 Tax=Amaricoccus solimangrovi TaxID=2589815 RepID=A0A501WPA8_9RHOB|nr:glycosyltransferase [Amaricoccus solimangrovi]TPE49127.1 glycosyltransferase family 4 protein [Amaricoccus solimangrovi]
MKVAIVHYWLIGMRGGERVLEALCALYPEAVIITHVADRAALSERILRHEIRETFIARLPGARKHYQKYLPLMPLALEMVDLSEFDLVISSESGPAKGVIPRPDALHVCYCHSPMRYVWDHFHVYRARAGRLTRWMMPLIAHRLRIWDVTSAARVDAFVANSHFIAQRIGTYYRREATVVAPPVAVDEFTPVAPEAVGDHYLLAGELVSYKRPDLAVEAFTRSGRKLRVIGDGDQRRALEAMAGPNVEFLGKVPFSRLREEFATCRALVFPGEEDFGIIPVELMAAGRPVIAYGRGGALDSVVPGVTGHFFAEQTPAALEEAVEEFESGLLPELDGAAIRAHAESFAPEVFARGIQAAVAAAFVATGKGVPVAGTSPARRRRLAAANGSRLDLEVPNRKSFA